MKFLTKIVVDGQEYDAIPYEELHDTATSSESTGYISGKTNNQNTSLIFISGILIVLILFFFLHKKRKK